MNGADIYIQLFNMFTLTEMQLKQEVVSVQVKEFLKAQCFEKLSRSYILQFCFNTKLSSVSMYNPATTKPFL